VAAGEPVFVTTADPTNVALASNAGGGLMGLTDPETVSADGSLPETLKIGSEVLSEASNPGVLAFGGVTAPSGPLGIPGNMLDAYMRATHAVNTALPGCHMEWSLLASIGRIESNHARSGRVDSTGRTNPLILGPVLNGGGFAAISDTDGGRYDGDARWDRAVGPMQFIPSTWKGYASDGNGDGETDPNNIYDASIGSAKYLCSGGMDMAVPQQRATAVFRYNHSDSYVRTVLDWAVAYAKGVTPMATTPVAHIEQLAAPVTTLPAAGVITSPAPTAPLPTTTPPAEGIPSSTSSIAGSTPGSSTTSSSTTQPSSTAPSTTPSTTPPSSTVPTTSTSTTPTATPTSPTCSTVPTTTTTATPSPAPNPCAPVSPDPTATPTTTGSLGSALPTP
jgi:hypothetical protein